MSSADTTVLGRGAGYCVGGGAGVTENLSLCTSKTETRAPAGSGI